MKMGFVEQRQSERVQVSLKATYQVLTENQARDYQNNPDFIRQYDASMAAFSKGETVDVSEGGLALVGVDLFRTGYKVLLRLELPETPGELMYMTEVRWVQAFTEANVTRYRAGLKFLYLRKGDGKKLTEYLHVHSSQKPPV
jgi:c-di-GMP-binding flagellar brake protein YcgR